MPKLTAAITAVQGYVPEYVLTNKELEAMVDTTDEWITSRTGIKERRILKGIDPKEIDLLICATVTPDMQFPATANIITNAVGATNAFGFDVNAACSGLLFSIVTASKYIESGQYKKVVVVGADKMSSIID